MLDISHLTTNGKILFLSCTHGLEHGPEDFNEQTIDPRYVFELGVKAEFNALLVGKGIAEKYYPEYRTHIPLLIRLNGHSRFNQPGALPAQNCAVAEAVALGAAAVDYVVHLGSLQEGEMLTSLGRVVREAHQLGIPVMASVYPRGPQISEPHR